MKKYLLIFLFFIVPMTYSFDVKHALAIDTTPTIRFLMRSGFGIGVSYEMWMENIVGIDLSLSYGAFGAISFNVITPRLLGKYYFNASSPFYNYLALVIEDDIAGNSDTPYSHYFGVGAGIGSKIIVSGMQGLFFEPLFMFLVKFSTEAPTITDFQIGAKIGWIF